MSANTKIEWADHTFNPWIGCTQVSPGCDNCYARAWDRRFAVSGHARRWGPGVPRQRTADSTWAMPVKWNKQAAAAGVRYRVFCASLADVFDNEVPAKWRMDLFTLIHATPHLDWLLLTKRIGNVMPMCSGDSLMFDMIQERVWLGATVVNQEEADRDIPKLLAVPARVRFLSMEPLLGTVDIGLMCENWSDDIVMDPETGARECCKKCDYTGIGNDIDWVIVGGESGPNARPMHPDWARALRDECQAAGVPFFFKQWGEWAPTSCANYAISATELRHGHVDGISMFADGTVSLLDLPRHPPIDIDYESKNRQWFLSGEGGYQYLHRVGKKTAGRHLDGRTWDEVPTP